MKRAMTLEEAPDIKERIEEILKRTPFDHVDASRIYCMRSYHSKSRARARIWSFPRIWQEAMHVSSRYVIEVVSQHFDHLKKDDQTRVLIHELMHIPKTFSGALVPHRTRYHRIDHRSVEKLFQMYKKKRKGKPG
jgi:predicted metallopeptidase